MSLYTTVLEVDDIIVTKYSDRYIVTEFVPDSGSRIPTTYALARGMYIDQNDVIDTSVTLDIGYVDFVAHVPVDANGMSWLFALAIVKNKNSSVAPAVSPSTTTAGTWTYSFSSDVASSIDQVTIKQTIDAPKKSQSRECPCGIFRADCTYHR